MTCNQRRSAERLHGVIVFCGMEGVSNSCLMSAGNLDFQIIDLFSVCFWPKLSRYTADWGKWVVQAQELRWRSSCPTHMVILNSASFDVEVRTLKPQCPACYLFCQDSGRRCFGKTQPQRMTADHPNPTSWKRTLELGGFDLEPFDEIMANHAREHGVFGGTLEIWAYELWLCVCFWYLSYGRNLWSYYQTNWLWDPFPW